MIDLTQAGNRSRLEALNFTSGALQAGVPDARQRPGEWVRAVTAFLNTGDWQDIDIRLRLMRDFATVNDPIEAIVARAEKLFSFVEGGDETLIDIQPMNMIPPVRPR